MQRGPRRRAPGLSMHHHTRASRKAGVGERRESVPTDNVVAAYERVTGHQSTLTKRDVRTGFCAEQESAALPRRNPGLGSHDAGGVDPVPLLQVDDGRRGGRSVVAGPGQPEPAAAEFLLEALEVPVGVTLHELLARPPT